MVNNNNNLEMNRLINTWVTVFAILTMITIQGFPLNEMASELHHKTISIDADETTTTVKVPNLNNLKPSDSSKNDTKARQIFNQADEDQPESNTNQFHRYLSPGQGYCLNSASMANLFNTAALAEQSSFSGCCDQRAAAGCDGNMIQMSQSTFAADNSVLSHADPCTVYQFWKVTFSQTTLIKTTLFINRDNCPACGARFQFYKATFGTDVDVTKNPTCVEKGAMSDGGWYACPNLMTGTVFGFYVTGTVAAPVCFNFMEVMSFTQEAIQLKANVIVSVIGTNNPTYPAANAKQYKVALLYTESARQKCVQITPPAGGLATFSMKFDSQKFIKAVVLLPGYAIGSTNQIWASWQKGVAVAIYAKTAEGTQKLCQILTDYYSKYNEAACNFQANEIVVEQQTSLKNLVFCGFGALAECSCAQSSLDPARFTTTKPPLASVTSLSLTIYDGVQTIQIEKVPDTVSTSSGCAPCGDRSLSFKDKLAGVVISSWPYRGFNFDAATLILTLNPALADASSVLTVTVSLNNYPSVKFSQDITVTVTTPTAGCDCTQTTFLSTPTPLASKTSLSLKSTDSVQTILITKLTDIASSTCGVADGLTLCGPRSFLFQDKLTGVAISTWPYRGLNFDTATSILTLDPALADASIVLTVIISLTNYPTVQKSQDINATVFNCNCAMTSFLALPTPLASPTQLSLKSIDSVQTIQITKLTDTVSKTCGSADGLTLCGPRQFSFKDKLTGVPITTWPFKGYNFDGATSQLTLDPSLADEGTSAITVTVSLTGYPAVQLSEDITVSKTNVDCNCAMTSFSQSPKLAVPEQLQCTVTDRVKTFVISNLSDSVSGRCGNSDGFTQCGPRQFQFADENGLVISTWPYKGFNFDAVTSLLALQPAEAYDYSGLKVIISLLNYPSVQMSQIIKVNVIGGKTDKKGLSYDFTKQFMTIIEKIEIKQHETGEIQLPDLGAANSYMITGQTKLNAKIQGNTLRLEAGNSPLGKYQMTIISKEGTAVTIEVEVEIVAPFVDTNGAEKAIESFVSDKGLETSIASESNFTANKTGDQEPAIMYLQKITNRGNLTIKFSKEVFKIVNVTDWKLNTEIIIKKSEDYSYDTNFTIFNMTDPFSLTIFLNFSAPLNVSASSIPDELYVKFNQTMLTKSNLLPVVYLYEPIAIPMQLSGNRFDDILINGVAGAVDGMNTVTGGTFAASMFVNFGLGQVLGDLKGLTVICTLYCANLQFPALSRQVGSQLLQFVQFDLFDCGPLYDKIFGEDETKPYTGNFGSAGYGSRKLVRVMGSLFIMSLITLVLSMFGKILTLAKFLPEPLRSKISEYLNKIYWNHVLSFIKQNFIMLVMGSLLNITNIEMPVPQPSSRRLDVQTLGITGQKLYDFHVILSFAVLAVCTAAPVTFISLSCRYFEKLKDKMSKQSLTWGAQMSNIKIQRVLIKRADHKGWNLNQFKLTKSQAILATSLSYIYELLVIFVLIYLNDHPWAQLTGLNVLTIAKLMVFLYLKPFEDEGQNRSEITSQSLILIFVLTLRCFTDWLPNTQTRQYVAYGHIFLLLVFVILMVLPVLSKMLAKLQLVYTLMTLICKRKHYLIDIAFVFRNNEWVSKCIKTMLEKQNKSEEKITLSKAVEMVRNKRKFVSSQIQSQLRFDSATDLIPVKSKSLKQQTSVVQNFSQLDYDYDQEQLYEDHQRLLARVRKMLELQPPEKQMNQIRFDKIQRFYRGELSTYKEVNKKNMATLVEVLSYVSHTKWPHGMNHIKEVEQLIPGWTALKNLDWKWLTVCLLIFT